MRKIVAFAIFLLFLTITLASANAKSNNPNVNDNAQVPEVSGDYAVPGRNDLRVRVFVHTPKSDKNLTPVTSAICEDNRSDSVTGKTGWKLPISTINYKINQSSAPLSVRNNVPTMISDSFNKWLNGITLDSTDSAKPNLVYSGLTSINRARYDGQNIIAWGRTSGSTLGVTSTWYYTATGLVAETDTIMNDRISWSSTCSSTYYNAEDIMIHELGHWFGLNDEYDNSFIDNTMYGYGSRGEVKKITPENGDFLGLNLIY